jgi:hypothetical protein
VRFGDHFADELTRGGLLLSSLSVGGLRLPGGAADRRN